MTVRIAKEEDRLEVWRLALQSHRENGLFPISILKVDWWITRALSPQLISEIDVGPRSIIGVIGDLGGHLEAMAMVSIGSLWYSDEKFIEDLTVYVDPEHRKSRNAQMLLDWMEGQSDLLRIPLMAGVISNVRTEAKCRLYQRRFDKAGAFFVHKPNGVG